MGWTNQEVLLDRLVVNNLTYLNSVGPPKLLHSSTKLFMQNLHDIGMHIELDDNGST